MNRRRLTKWTFISLLLAVGIAGWIRSYFRVAHLSLTLPESVSGATCSRRSFSVEIDRGTIDIFLFRCQKNETLQQNFPRVRHGGHVGPPNYFDGKSGFKWYSTKLPPSDPAFEFLGDSWPHFIYNDFVSETHWGRLGFRYLFQDWGLPYDKIWVRMVSIPVWSIAVVILGSIMLGSSRIRGQFKKRFRASPDKTPARGFEVV